MEREGRTCTIDESNAHYNFFLFRELNYILSWCTLQRAERRSCFLLTKANRRERAKEGRVGWYTRERSLLVDLDVSARGVPLIVVEAPAPLKEVRARGRVGRNLEASTARTNIRVAGLVTVGVVQGGNLVLVQDGLGMVLLQVILHPVDEDLATIAITGVVLGGPADAEVITGSGDGHLAPGRVLARGLVVGIADLGGAGLVGARLLTRFAIRAGGLAVEVLELLLVVAVGIGVIEGGELGLDGVAAGVSLALAVGPLVGVARRLPVDAVDPGVGLSLRSEVGENGQGGDEEDGEGGLENHVG